MKPALQVVGGTFKLDLDRGDQDVVFPARVVNDGDGTAHAVSIRLGESVGRAELSALEPSTPFDLPPGTERLIRLTLSNAPGEETLELTAVLECHTANGTRLGFEQSLEFEQQRTQPDWDELLRNPPYAINPIREKKDLYGRDSVLAELELHVSNETSTFLWGQKRVGKTSVLQVLAAKLDERGDIACIVLRMGELASLHEGQLGHTIATRLISVLGIEHEAPKEDEFRAGLGRLVPYVEELARETDRKMLVIIDEFDDLNPAFYLGERGKQFVKALRSLSEVGLTFMFVGSERMNSIYHSHSADLNKWVNSSLDRIEVDADCEALVIEPVAGKIEYEPAAVKRIVEYCRGNPFYMHLVGGKVFQRCAQERRTFVGTSDFDYVRRSLVRELGPTNFAHFWEDVPVLDPNDKQRSVANNCLFLACVATLRSGGYESLDDLVEAQGQLGLEQHERLPLQDLGRWRTVWCAGELCLGKEAVHEIAKWNSRYFATGYLRTAKRSSCRFGGRFRKSWPRWTLPRSWPRSRSWSLPPFPSTRTSFCPCRSASSTSENRRTSRKFVDGYVSSTTTGASRWRSFY